MRKKSILHSPRIEELKRKRHRILRNKILFFVFLFLMILAGLVFLSRWEKINIDNVRISGNRIIETEAIEQIIHSNISGYYFGLFPKTNFLLYPKNEIKNELAQKFKRLKDISFDEKDIKTLNVSVSEYEGKYLWCGTELPEALLMEDSISKASGKICHFMDENGYIFDEAPYFSGEVFFRFYGKIVSSSENPIGSFFLPNNFEKIISFKRTVKEMGLRPSAFWEDNTGDMNLFLSPDDAMLFGPKIIFKIDSDFEKLAENLQAALMTEPLQSDFKNKFSSLLYIDLRFGNKVYYKFNE